jgi:hypothetical protein
MTAAQKKTTPLEPQASLEQQAALFSRYLIGQTPSATVVSRYVQAVQRGAAISAAERRLIAFACRHPWSIGCLDAGLVLVNPHVEFRRRLYVMFAILEATPEHSDYFLPRQRSPLYLLWLGVVGLRAVARAIIGLILLKVVRV